MVRHGTPGVLPLLYPAKPVAQPYQPVAFPIMPVDGIWNPQPGIYYGAAAGGANANPGFYPGDLNHTLQ